MLKQGLKTFPPFAELTALYRTLDERYSEWTGDRPKCRACGNCCRFQEFGHALYVTPIEVAWLLRCARPLRGFDDSADRCPWQDDKGLCVAREGRTFGCRAFFCELEPPLDVDLEREKLLGSVRTLNERAGFDPIYAPFDQLLASAASTGGFLEAKPKIGE